MDKIRNILIQCLGESDAQPNLSNFDLGFRIFKTLPTVAASLVSALLLLGAVPLAIHYVFVAGFVPNINFVEIVQLGGAVGVTSLFVTAALVIGIFSPAFIILHRLLSRRYTRYIPYQKARDRQKKRLKSADATMKSADAEKIIKRYRSRKRKSIGAHYVRPLYIFYFTSLMVSYFTTLFFAPTLLHIDRSSIAIIPLSLLISVICVAFLIVASAPYRVCGKWLYEVRTNFIALLLAGLFWPSSVFLTASLAEHNLQNGIGPGALRIATVAIFVVASTLYNAVLAASLRPKWTPALALVGVFFIFFTDQSALFRIPFYVLHIGGYDAIVSFTGHEVEEDTLERCRVQRTIGKDPIFPIVDSFGDTVHYKCISTSSGMEVTRAWTKGEVRLAVPVPAEAISPTPIRR